MNSRTKPPVALVLPAVLLMLVLISVHMTCGMFARFTAKATRPDDEARVAAYDVSAEAPTEDPVTIIADGTDENGIATYTVKVKNDSETAVKYDAVVLFNDEDKAKFDDNDDKLTFSGYLDADSVAEEQLTFDMSEYFKTNDKYSTFRNDDISGDMGKCPFTVSVNFTQIN